MYLPRIHRRAPEIFVYYPVSFGICVHDMTGYLLYRLHFFLIGERREWSYVLLARLDLKAGKIYRRAKHARRGAGLEAPDRHTRPGKRVRQRGGGQKAVGSRGIIAVAHKNAAVKVCSCRHHHRVAVPFLADGCGNAANAASVFGRHGPDLHHLRLHGVQVRRGLKRVLHDALVKAAICLYPL